MSSLRDTCTTATTSDLSLDLSLAGGVAELSL